MVVGSGLRVMRAVSTLVLGAALCAAPVACAQAPEPDLGGSEGASDDGSEREGAPGARAGEPGMYVSPGAIVGFVASGVGLATFAIAGGLAIGEDLRLREVCASLCYRGAGDDLRTFALISDLGLGLMIAGAALGGLFLLADRGPDRSGVVSVAPMLDDEGGGLLVLGRL